MCWVSPLIPTRREKREGPLEGPLGPLEQWQVQGPRLSADCRRRLAGASQGTECRPLERASCRFVCLADGLHRMGLPGLISATDGWRWEGIAECASVRIRLSAVSKEARVRLGDLLAGHGFRTVLFRYSDEATSDRLVGCLRIGCLPLVGKESLSQCMKWLKSLHESGRVAFILVQKLRNVW